MQLLERLPKSGNIVELDVNAGGFSEEILRLCTPKTLHLVDVWISDRFDLYDLVKNKYQEKIHSDQVDVHKKLSTEAVEDFKDNYFDWI